MTGGPSSDGQAPASPPTNAGPSSPAPYRPSVVAPAVLLVYLSLSFGAMHAGAVGLTDPDGYFHARLASMFFERGLSREFPWTQASVWKDRYCDKEFLYHLAMAPFTAGEVEPLRGALLFSTILGVAVFAALYFVLRWNGVPWPAAFAALPACLGPGFMLRLLMIRPHVLSIVLNLIGLHFLIRGRWKAMAVLGFVYSWSYSFPFALLMTAVPFVFGRWLSGGGLDWKSAAAAGGGALAGLAIHPFTPLTFDSVLTILKIMYSSLGGTKMPLANEFASPDARMLLLSSPLFCAAIAVLCVGGWRLGRKISPEATGILCAALFWTGAAMVSYRFIEYSHPMMVAAAAFVFRDAGIAERLEAMACGARRSRRLSAAACAAVIIAAAHLHSIYGSWAYMRGTSPRRFSGACAWLSAHAAAGETVVNLRWDEFPELFYDGYRQYYLWAMDPVFTLRYDPAKALLLRDILWGRRPVEGPELAREFGARYMVLSEETAEFLRSAGTMSSEWKPVYADGKAAVFALEPPGGGKR
jgi:hypothetical protein